MRRSSFSTSIRRPLTCALLAATALAAGCHDGVTAPTGQPEASLIVSASVVGTPVATLAVEVTGPGIDQRLVFNLTVVNGTASGTIKMPPGDARTITVRAYDSNGDVTHEGSKTVDVKRGQNPPVTIPMVPRAGQVPITVTLGSVTITVEPANSAVDVGATLQLTATITAPNGDVFPGPAAWATTDPTKATVDQAGLVTALAEGSVEIVATYAGVAGASEIVVLTGSSLAFSAVSTGHSSTCGIALSGTYCWGDNSSGQLGTSSQSSSLIPQPVTGGLTFTALSFGNEHACGIAAGGKAYCWGLNASAQLGDATLTMRTTPTAVAGTLTLTAISAGSDHTCGIAPGGKAYCWGAGGVGQLGHGDFAGQAVPAEVAGAHTFTSLVAGQLHTCGLTTDGKAYCWGAGLWGPLGNGSPANQSIPVEVAGAHAFTSLSAGLKHTCGLTTDGKTYCWGDGSYGQLGIGSGMADIQRSPVEVVGAHAFITLSAGGIHTCGIAADGKTYCWGDNGNGELGNGAFSDVVRAPVEVLTSLKFASLSQGSMSFATCGLTLGKAAYCWGYGRSGQLGNGTTSSSNVPAPVLKP